MSCSSPSTRWALKALSSSTVAARVVRPHLHLPSSSSLSLGRRSISSARPLSLDLNDDGFPKVKYIPSSSSDTTTPPPSTANPNPNTASFPPNFFTSLIPTSVLEEALEAANQVPLTFLTPVEQANHRLLLRHLNRGVKQPTLELRTRYFTACDLSYAPRSAIDRRQREKARKQVENGIGQAHDELTMEEWDEKSRKRVEEKLAALEAEEGEEGGEGLGEEAREEKERKKEMIKKKILATQALYRRTTVLRREVRREMEKEEK